MLAVHHWLMPSLHVFILVLAALLGLLWAPWGLLVFRMLGGPVSAAAVVCAVVVVPCGWLMIELVRSWEALGGPWGCSVRASGRWPPRSGWRPWAGCGW